MNDSRADFDIAVVGASVAGCTAARLWDPRIVARPAVPTRPEPAHEQA